MPYEKTLLILTLFVLAINSNAQISYVRICPHFNGIENILGRADSTNPNWPGSPVQYFDNDLFDSSVIIEYMSWTSSGCPFDTRFLLQFASLTDTTIIPANSTIVSATLYLYGIPSTPTGDFGNSVFAGSPYLPNLNSGWLYELSSPFNNTTVTWNTQPDVKHTDSVAIPPSTTQWNDSNQLDVTALVTDLIANGNNGFEFRMQVENNPYSERLYASSRYSDSTLHPALVINFIAPTTSAVRSVNNLSADLSIYPNPAHSQLSAYVTVANNTSMLVNVIDVVGKTIYSSQENFHEGINTITIPLNELTPGMYVLEVSDQSTELKQKFVKQ